MFINRPLSLVFCCLLCYIRDHDGNGSQTVTQKVPNSRCYKLHRSYSNSFNLSNVGDFFRSWIYNPGQKSLGQCCNIHIFLSFLASLLKQYILFEIFLQFSLPPPYRKLKRGKNLGYTRPTLFVGWGEGLDLNELENAPEMQKCPKTFVHDCRGLY